MKSQMMAAGVAVAALAIAGASLIDIGASASTVVGRATAPAVHACATHARPGHATCFAIAIAGSSGRIVGAASPIPSAFTPGQIQQAYGLTGLNPSGRTVAIVDAFGYSRLESDLAVYRSTYGLPACTRTNGCLRIMDQHGGTHYPPDNQGWDLEQALDVDAVSAACPLCRILVVQATTNSYTNLGAAVNRAAIQSGVDSISNSYGGSDRTPLPAYNHLNFAVTASAGDGGYPGGVSYPASDKKVVAVGGTSLFPDGSARGFSETAWTSSGSGCSTFNNQPAFQTTSMTSCPKRALVDVAAAADPANGGLNVYDSGYGGWVQVGGTSESTALIAAVYTLSGTTSGRPAKYPYLLPGYLYDITTGGNGSCTPVIWCQAGPGWDGPTGMGTPNGVLGF